MVVGHIGAAKVLLPDLAVCRNERRSVQKAARGLKERRTHVGRKGCAAADEVKGRKNERREGKERADTTRQRPATKPNLKVGWAVEERASKRGCRDLFYISAASRQLHLHRLVGLMETVEAPPTLHHT